MTTRLINNLEASAVTIPVGVMNQILDRMENIFRPEFQASLSPETRTALNGAIANGMSSVYWIVLGASLLCFCAALFLTKQKPSK